MEPNSGGINIKELEAKLLKDQDLLNRTYLFWRRLINEKTSLLAKFNENPEDYSEEEIYQVELDVRSLIAKATFEIQEQKKYEIRAKELFRLKRIERLKKFNQFKKKY